MCTDMWYVLYNEEELRRRRRRKKNTHTQTQRDRDTHTHTQSEREELPWAIGNLLFQDPNLEVIEADTLFCESKPQDQLRERTAAGEERERERDKERENGIY